MSRKARINIGLFLGGLVVIGVVVIVPMVTNPMPSVRAVMSGWTMTTYYPNAAIRADFGAYERQNNLPDDGGATFFYEDGSGNHRILIVASVCHILTYDSKDSRVSIVLAKGK
jgi:hypothetical protein